MKNSINPLKLADEWRDTLFYKGGGSLLFAYAAYETTKRGIDVPFVQSVLDTALYSSFGREIARSIFWSRHKEMAVDGYQKKGFDKHKLSCISMASVWMSLGLREIIALSPALTLFCSVFLLDNIKGAQGDLSNFKSFPKDWYRAYKDVMFDYPRKKDDGGTTQTQKLVDGFKKLAGKIGKLVPTPAPAPGFVPIPVRRQRLDL